LLVLKVWRDRKLQRLQPWPQLWSSLNAMTVQITIRDVPEGVREELASRATRRAVSMQEFLRRELEQIAARPSLDS